MHYDYETCTEGDCALCNEIANRGLKTTISPIEALGDLLIDAITRLNDKIENFKPTTPTTPVDLSAVTAQFAAERDAVQAKLDSLVMAIDAKIAAIPAPDISAYSTTEDSQSYADTGDTQTLQDASEYADAADALLADKIAQSHDELVNLIIDHAVPAAAVAAAASFDPKVLDQAKADIVALQNADKLQAATAVTGSKGGAASALILWTGTKIQYDALTTKDPGTVYFIQ
jgi:hypothetical protein